VFGSDVQREELNSHVVGLSGGHVQKPRDVLQTLSPVQGEEHVMLLSVHTLLTQVWLLPHGLLQPPQCWTLEVMSVSQSPSPSQSASPEAQGTTHSPFWQTFPPPQSNPLPLFG